MKELIPPLTVAVDLVIYKEHVNLDTLTIIYEGFVVNNLLWYKLRKSLYTFKAIKKEMMEDFLQKNKHFKIFPEQDLLEDYGLVYDFKLVESTNYFRKKSLVR